MKRCASCGQSVSKPHAATCSNASVKSKVNIAAPEPEAKIDPVWPIGDRPPERPDIISCNCKPMCAGWKQHNARNVKQ